MEFAGHKCIGFCEYDKFPVASYTMMHLATEQQRKYIESIPALKERQKEILKEEYRGGEWYANDIRRVEARSLPKADCWCFGFPCQDISIAGKQLGFSGRRSSLFFAVTGLIKDLSEEDRPSILFIENVKNLLSVNRGLDFARLLIELDEIGYDAEWCVLNSKDFGVPQNRERVFIVGHFRGRGGREVFPIRCTNSEINIKVVAQLAGKRRQRNDILSPIGCATCLDTMQGGGHEPKIAIPVLTPDRVEKRQNGRRFKENGEPMFTLTSQDRHGVAIIDDTQGFDGTRVYDSEVPTLRSQRNGLKVSNGIRIRKLTPRECFRLQGWSDEYFDRAAMINSDSQLYKQAGNGVTVNVIQAIAERL